MNMNQPPYDQEHYQEPAICYSRSAKFDRPAFQRTLSQQEMALPTPPSITYDSEGGIW